MKTKLIILLTALISLFTHSVFAGPLIITGAGATFPYPVYVKWAEHYHKLTGIIFNYQPIGSGGGIKQIQAHTVQFGASDKPLSYEELQQNHLIQFPTVIGGVVPVINIPNIQSGQLKLTGSVLANIYLGHIKKWNDPLIAQLNPNLALPDKHITVVHRSDGSGTTFLFTHYLAKVSNEWKTKVGSDTAVAWLTGIGGKGNEGVASYVQRVSGGIGYVEYAYAKQNQLKYVQLKNKSGNFVEPSVESFQAAAVNAHWNGQTNFSEILTDQTGAQSWPISGATFILMHDQVQNPEQTKAVLKFFDWAYREGKQMALSMDYVPLPDSLVQRIQTYWRDRLKDSIWP